MSIDVPKKAMVLAAGLGKRLRPYTNDVPKPLLQIAGKHLIDWTLDHLEHSDIDDVIMNTFYRADKVREHVEQRYLPRVKVVIEEELMGTGGAVLNALDFLGPKPFFVLHSNIVWINKGRSVFTRMADYWDDAKMDVLALIVDKTKLPWHKGRGDYVVEDTEYRMKRTPAGQDSPILSAGIYMIHPRAFKDMPDGAFPLSVVIERASATGRFFGLQHQGDWYGINTADDYVAVNNLLSG